MTGGGVDGELRCDRPCFSVGDGFVFDASELVCAPLAHDGEHAVAEVGGDGAERLVVVLASMHHEAVVEERWGSCFLAMTVARYSAHRKSRGPALLTRPRLSVSPLVAFLGTRPVLERSPAAFLHTLASLTIARTTLMTVGPTPGRDRSGSFGNAAACAYAMRSSSLTRCFGWLAN